MLRLLCEAWFPADDSLRETALATRNKVLQISSSFVAVYSGGGVGSASCTGVWFFASGVLLTSVGVTAWCSGKMEVGGRGEESGESTAAVLSSRIPCNYPKFGVHSLISSGEDGWLRIRCVAHDLGRHRRQALLRKTMTSGGEDFVVIFMLLKDLSARKECTVLSFLI